MTVTSEPGNGFTRAQIGAAISPRIQELIILPTEKCNFRCTYCYEDFKLGRMSESVQRSIELFLARRIPEIDMLSLAWFGGEPLVAKDVVLRIARYAKSLCDEHGVTLDGSMTTNGYLIDDRILDVLFASDHRFFQITLDGWRESHDAVRKRVDGKGTFDRIWESLHCLSARHEYFEVAIRVHVRRENIASSEELMRSLKASFGGDSRFRVDFQHLRDLGGEGGKTINDPISISELGKISARLRRILVGNLPDEPTSCTQDSAIPKGNGIDVSFRGESFGSRVSDQEDVPYICYAARPNSLLIRADGRIGKCTVALSSDSNDVGRLLDDGTIEINNQRLRRWIRGIDGFDPSSLSCPMVGIEAPPISAATPGKKIVPIAVL
jgi:uncharacterized protein